MGDNVSKFYNAFSQKYDNFGTEQEFRDFLKGAKRENIDNLYKAFNAKYDNFNSADDMVSYLGWSDSSNKQPVDNSKWAVTPSPYWNPQEQKQEEAPKQEERPVEQPKQQAQPQPQPAPAPVEETATEEPEANPFPYRGGLEQETAEIARLRETVAEDKAFVEEYEKIKNGERKRNQMVSGVNPLAGTDRGADAKWLKDNKDRYKQAKANVEKVESVVSEPENAINKAETDIARRKNREEMASPSEIIATGRTPFGGDNAGRQDSEHQLRKYADELYASADKEYDKSSKYQEGYEGNALEQLWTGIRDFGADALNNIDSGSFTFGLSKGLAGVKAREVGDKYNDIINSALKDMGMSEDSVKSILSSIEESVPKLEALEEELTAAGAEIDTMSSTYEDMVRRGDPNAESYGRQLQKKIDAYNKRINDEYKPTWDAYNDNRQAYEDVMAGIDTAIESGLTGGEKALLDALEKFTQAKTLRSDDVSVAGKAGAGAEQSAEFMLDFILTGGISKAGTKVATKIATNRALKKFGADALKEMARVGKTVKPGLGLRLGTDVVTSLARTGVMAPRTIQAYSENLTEYNGKDETGRYEWDRTQANALANSLLTQYIEYWSEGFGEYFGEAEQALFRSITKNAPKAAIGQTLRGYRGSIGQYLDKGKFDGMFNEMLEEVVGSTFNAIAGWMSGDRVGDAGAMKEFFAGENLATLALSFLPMSAIGAATNLSAYHKMKERYDKGAEAMDRFVKSGAIFQEELQQLARDIPELTPAEIKDKIVDITDRARKANGGRLPSDFTQNVLGYLEGEFAMGLRYDEWEDSQEKMSVVNAYTASYTNPDARAAWDLNDNEQTARQAALDAGFTEEELDNDSYMLAQDAFEIKGTQPERADALMNYASAKAAAEGLRMGYKEQTQQVSEIFDERVRRNVDTNGTVTTATIMLNGKPRTVFITQEDASVDANGNLTTPTGPEGVVRYRLNEMDEEGKTAPASQFSNAKSTDTTQFVDDWQNNFQRSRAAYYEAAQNTVSPTGQARAISEKVGQSVIVTDHNGVYQPFKVERLTNGGSSVVLSGDKKALQGVAEAMGIRVPTSGYLEAPVTSLYPLLAKEEDGSLSTGLGETSQQEAAAPAASAQETASAAEQAANLGDLRDQTVPISVNGQVQNAHVIDMSDGSVMYEELDGNGDVVRTARLTEDQFARAMQEAANPTPAAESKQTQAVKPMDAKDFDIDSIDFDNNYVILHQTGTQNFDSILQNGLRVGAGLNGTTTLANRETLEAILQAQAEGRGHEGSDGLIILQIPKSWANGRDIRNLDQIDDILTERFGDSAIQTVPTDVITHAIVTPKENTIPVDEKTGEKIYDAPGVRVEDAIADLYATEGLTEADVDQYIAEEAAKAEAARNPERGNMSPQAWGQAKQEAARVADFWAAMQRAAEQRKAQQEAAIEEAVEEATPVETTEAQPAPESKQRIAPAATPMTVDSRRKVVARLKNWARRTGVKVNIIRSVDEVKDETARKALKEGRALTGWFNDKTGQVDIFLPNVMNAVEADKTFIHETVAHKGLRGLLGEEGYDALCDRVWNELMTPEEQQEFMEYNRHLQGTEEYLRRAAADEYIARLSENMDMQDNRNIFERIVDWIMDLLGLGGNVSGIEEGAADKATAEGSLTRSDLYDLLEDSLKRFEKGRKKLNTESLPAEIQNEMQAKGLVMDGGAVMDEQQGELKKATGYQTPNELETESSPEVGYVRFSESTMPAWARNYMTYRDAKKHVVQVLENFVRDVAADELVHGMVPTGVYKYGEKSSGSFAGPLRTNIEYIVTFDMDTSCPRSLQYLEYVKQIEAQIGRPLTQVESIQLIEMMRMYGQMIPCVYCYCENKRQALKQYYTDFMKARHGVINAKTEEEALAAMYGHNTTAEAQESNDPAVVLTPAAYEVFKKWRQEKDYNPTIEQLWYQYRNDRNVILTVLDNMLASGAVATDMSDKKITNALCKDLGITGTEAKGAVNDIVSEWKWDCIEDRKHNDFTRIEDEDDLVLDNRTLTLWREMTSYGKSASGAKNVLRYVPYTDELKTLSQEQRDFINGLGGLRMHSSNDFRIDYVLDYFQFMADMAVNKMFGHTYTKSPEFVRIFGNSGYKINMSVAAYEDSRGIRPNADEGFDWTTARELREQFPNAGVMMMATSDAQIQFALDNDWIDMCIPFHHSGLPKAVWYQMRHWSDYTSTQNEKFLNATEMRAALKADGVAVPNKLTAAAVEKMYIDHFNIKILRGKDGKRMRPHFLPGPTPKDGVIIPGHNNDYDTYIRLCREYGVHPRFYGIKVKDNTPEGGGREVDITEHPGYMKFIKETARTDSPQTAIEFNFDQPSEALGGRSPIEYALEELKARAQAESEMAGGPVRNIYESYKQDPYGIVPQFINGVINHEEEYRKTHNGEELPLDYLTPDSRKWFMTERKALEDAYKDFDTIPYHPHEYDENGNLIMTNAEGAPETQSEMVAEEEVANTMFREIDPRDFVPNVRGGWTEKKILKYLKENSSRRGVGTAAQAISEFDNIDDLKDHMFYHGTTNYIEGGLKPSITRSEKWIENNGGGGYGDRYWGISLSKDKRVASNFSGIENYVKIYPVILVKNAKVIERPDFTDAYDAGEHIVDLWEQGVDAVWIGDKNSGEQELLVLNPRAIVNIGTSDFYKVYHLGSEDNPLNIADDAAIEKMYNTAKEYVAAKPNRPLKPMKPSRFNEVDGELIQKTDEEYAEELANWENAVAEYEQSDEKRAYDDIVDKARRDIRFREANRNQLGFVSNAEAALDRIKMDKATPEQWQKMLEKEGGLKAGEDKWLGLSDWLTSQDRKSITKDEIADYIDEHRIMLAEADYADEEPNQRMRRIDPEAAEAFDYTESAWSDRVLADITDTAKAVALYNRDNPDDQVTAGPNGEMTPDDRDKVLEYAENLYIVEADVNRINSIRLGYTTEGLDNKREIALVVPTIESWNADDKIHFGDAGNGRAVAWVRFGDTFAANEGEKAANERHREAARALNEYREELIAKYALKATGSKRYTDLATPEEMEKLKALKEEEKRFYDEWDNLNATPRRVLVIDEIQSKRHQEGREKGYKSSEVDIDALEQKWRDAMKESDEYVDSLIAKYGDLEWPDRLTDEEYDKVKELDAASVAAAEAVDKAKVGIPAAPFEKNWHELAMKRMLRLAAEEGYDAVAWTTGGQQADRYNLSSHVHSILVNVGNRGNRNVTIRIKGSLGSPLYFTVDSEGNVISYAGPNRFDNSALSKLSDVVGKDMAEKIMGAENGETISGEGLKMGGEGMRGFYDDILPRFMNKYGKKWGVKVSDITLPNVEESGEIMHSVPVTQEMKESVMRGQTMFRDRDAERREEMKQESMANDRFNKQLGFTEDVIAYYQKNHRMPPYYKPSTYRLGNPFGNLLSAGMEDIPIRMKEENLLDVSANGPGLRHDYHKYEISDLRDLVTLLNHPIAVFRSGRNGFGILLNKKDRNGNNYYAYLRGHEVPGEGIDHYEIISIYPVDKRGKQIDLLENLIGEKKGLAWSATDKRLTSWINGMVSNLPSYYTTIQEVTANIRNKFGNKQDLLREEAKNLRPSGNTMFRERVTPEQDKEYMDAVNAGDMEKAGRMVRDAFKAAFPDTKVVDENGEPKVLYHGTDKVFTEFNPAERGLWFTEEMYAGNYGSRKMPVFLNMENPGAVGDRKDWRDKGFDGWVDMAGPYKYFTAVVANPSQVKSADPVTYDDNGNVVPLSERFNPENNDIRFREARPVDARNAQAGYEEEINRSVTNFLLEWQDQDIPVRIAINQVMNEVGMDNLPEDCDYLTRHNLVSSRADAQMHNYKLFFFEPMMQTIGQIEDILVGGKPGFFDRLTGRRQKRLDAYKKIVDYCYAVSALERNAWKRAEAQRLMEKALERLSEKWEQERAAINADSRLTDEEKAKAVERAEKRYQKESREIEDKYADRDYSGITALMGHSKEEWQEAEDDARAMIADFQRSVNNNDLINEMWDRIRACTDFNLEHAYKYGLLSRAEYERLHGTESQPRMWEYYIPLRGFAEDTAEDQYNYTMFTSDMAGGDVVKKAKGRVTEADDPFATMRHISEQEIVQGLQNWAKQALYNFVLRAGNNSLLTQVEPWYVKEPGSDNWTVAEPNEGETLEEFEARMQEAYEDGDARRGRNGLKLGRLMGNKMHRNQHMVRLKLNGAEKMIWVNGNPILAQAINGISGWNNKILNGVRTVNRALSQFYTTYSLKFLTKNKLRDTQFSRIAALVDEPQAYLRQLEKNWWANNGIAFGYPMMKLVSAWESGELEKKENRTEREQMFIDFMYDGGATGYTMINSMDKIKRELERMVKNAGRGERNIPIIDWYAKGVGALNEASELLTRFTFYQTSRMMGRSRERSAYDAKESSVNFNRRGLRSGIGVSGWTSAAASALYLFINPAIQGLDKFVRLHKSHPWRMGLVDATYFMMGFVNSLLNAMIAGASDGDGDDEEKMGPDWYWNIPEWVRRSNMIIGSPFKKLGKWGYLVLALPIEYKGFYAMGELASALVQGKYAAKDAPTIANEVVGVVAELLPVNPVEGYTPGDNPAMSVVRNLMPDIAAPIMDVATNRSFAGIPLWKENIYDEAQPLSQSAFASTPEILNKAVIKLSEVTSDMPWHVDIPSGAVRGLLKGYGGGAYTFVEDMSKLIFADEAHPRRWDNVPFVSGFTGYLEEDRRDSFNSNALQRYKELSDDVVKRVRSAAPGEDLKAADIYNHPESLPQNARVTILLNSDRYILGQMYYNGMLKAGDDVKKLRSNWNKAKKAYLEIADDKNVSDEAKDAAEKEVQRTWLEYTMSEDSLVERLMEEEYNHARQKIANGIPYEPKETLGEKAYKLTNRK